MASPQQQIPVEGAAAAASDPWTTPIVADKDDAVTPDAGRCPRRRVLTESSHVVLCELPRTGLLYRGE